MDKAKSLKMALAVALVATLGVAVLAAYAHPIPADAGRVDKIREQKADHQAKDKQNDHLDDDDGDDDHREQKREAANSKRERAEELREKLEDLRHKIAAGASSVIVAKTSTPGSESITVLTPALKRMTLSVSNETKIAKNGATGDFQTMFARLAVGDHVKGKARDVNGTTKAVMIEAYTSGQLRTRGTVTANGNSSLTVQSPQGESAVLKVDTTATSPTFTVVKKGRDLIAPSSISVGEHVQLTFIVNSDGSLTAINIHVAADSPPQQHNF